MEQMKKEMEVEDDARFVQLKHLCRESWRK